MNKSSMQRSSGTWLCLVAFAATSCAAPAEPASAESASGESASGEPASGNVAEQRRAALVVHWLANARKLQAEGELARAHLELLKARDLEPRNEAVLRELAALEPRLPPRRTSWPPEGGQRLRVIEDERARALIAVRLRAVEDQVRDRDYAGALQALRGIESKIRLDKRVDWREVPGDVSKRIAQVEALQKANGANR